MQSFYRSLISVRHTLSSSRIVNLQSTQGYLTNAVRGLGAGELNSLYGLDAGSFIENLKSYSFCSFHRFMFHGPLALQTKISFQTESPMSSCNNSIPSTSLLCRRPGPSLFQLDSVVPNSPSRFITTLGDTDASVSQDSDSVSDVAPRIKFKRLDKTAKHIMQILDKEAVEEVRTQREIPDIKPGYIIQLKVVVPENKRRASVIKGIVIARRNAGLNSTFRLRRLVAGVGVESLFPLYSPNIKEIKVLDKKKVRRAKLYYLRDKMNALKKQ